MSVRVQPKQQIERVEIEHLQEQQRRWQDDNSTGNFFPVRESDELVGVREWLDVRESFWAGERTKTR